MSRFWPRSLLSQMLLSVAVALLLASARNVVPASTALARGEWKRRR